jgi:hypothetical protein
MKSSPYPLGTPMVYGEEDFRRLGLPKLPWHATFPKGMEGLMLVKVLPPPKMPMPIGAQQPFPPFLPYKTREGLLVFPLCARCSDTQNQKRCSHSDEERAWIAAFPHQDLEMALELGYTILDLYEVSFGV